jgi:hypothetical protein
MTRFLSKSCPSAASIGRKLQETEGFLHAENTR